MDVKAIADQVMSTLGEAPEKIQEFLADPKGAIEQITGQTFEEGQIAEVVEHIKTQIGEGVGNFDMSAIGEKFGDLFGEGSPLGGIGDAIGGLFGKK